MGVDANLSKKALTTFEKIMRKLDTQLSPGINYSNFGYSQRLQYYFLEIFRSKIPVKNFLNLVKLLLMMSLSWLLTPICFFLKQANFRFVDIDLSQIGSIMFLDLFLRENALNQKSPKNRIFVLGSNFFEGNKYINDLYKVHVTFIRNPFLKLLLSPFFVSPIFKNDSSHRYETIHSKVAVAHHVWNSFNRLNGKPLISMPHHDVKKAELDLAQHVDVSRPFVALHVREIGFYNITSQDTRNADIRTYKSSIRFLIEQGFNVIRMGDSSMQSTSEMQEDLGGAFFDYAKSEIKSPLVDCFLLSHCSFFIGCSSGPASIPFLFHRNSVNVNWHVAINGPNFLLGDITTIKRHCYRDTKKLVPFKRLLEEPFRYGPTKHELEKFGVILEDNTEKEILGTIKEFILHNEVSDLQLQAKKLIPNDGYSFGANGNYSKITLEQYFSQG